MKEIRIVLEDRQYKWLKRKKNKLGVTWKEIVLRFAE